MYKLYTTQDVRDSSNRNLFTFGDFFAGGGGSSTGIKLAGGKELFINEFVEEACTTFKTNYPDVEVFQGDIKKITGHEILQKIGLKPGELDLISGSPPCSAFSMAGKRDKGWGKEKNYSDGMKVENIEDLFFEYLRVVDVIKPKVVISENVEGMVTGEAAKYVARVIAKFDEIGYDAIYRVLDATDFGVPQARRRTIFAAVRKDVVKALGLSFFDFYEFLPTATYEGDVSIKNAIDSVENDPEEVEMLRAFVNKGYQKNVIPKLKFNPVDRHSKPNDPEHSDWNPKGSFFNMIRPAINKPCPTLTQQGQKRGLSGVLHYADNRKLTIKEMVILMSLPIDYELTGTFDQRAERICRMVAPVFMKAVAEHLYKTILKPYKELK